MNATLSQEQASLKRPGLPVFNLRKIVAPVDFSTRSSRALECARAFARQFAAEILLVHVVEPTVIPDNFGIVPPAYEEVGDALMKAAKERLTKLADDLSGELAKVKWEVCTGRPAWEIVRVAEEGGADLIIITTHGYTGLKHVLMGSTAELIVRHAKCPVLTIRSSEVETDTGTNLSGTTELGRKCLEMGPICEFNHFTPRALKRMLRALKNRRRQQF